MQSFRIERRDNLVFLENGYGRSLLQCKLGMSTATPISNREKSKKKREGPVSAAKLEKFGTNANIKDDNKARYIPARIFSFFIFHIHI